MFLPRTVELCIPLVLRKDTEAFPSFWMGGFLMDDRKSRAKPKKASVSTLHQNRLSVKNKYSKFFFSNMRFFSAFFPLNSSTLYTLAIRLEEFQRSHLRHLFGLKVCFWLSLTWMRKPLTEAFFVLLEISDHP